MHFGWQCKGHQAVLCCAGGHLYARIIHNHLSMSCYSSGVSKDGDVTRRPHLRTPVGGHTYRGVSKPRQTGARELQECRKVLGELCGTRPPEHAYALH